MDESRLARRSERIETSSSFSETRTVLRASAAPLLSSSSSSSSSSLATAPSGGQVRTRRSLPVWVQLLLLSAVAGFLFFVYQAMETNKLNPFGSSESSAPIAAGDSAGQCWSLIQDRLNREYPFPSFSRSLKSAAMIWDSVALLSGKMYPTTLTQLARTNPFSAPLFTLQQVEEPKQSPKINGPSNRRLAAAAVAEGDSCEFGSRKYLVLCGFGGILSCGTTHTAVVPLDLVKCRMQTRM
ncbi:hypothetical protein AAFF_G00076870 [Aldrovandia affinis]|uniref:Solute carrier family 25 member 3 n=1 Tax=Aldrovandia affinis TaxID=143900 RepID=A0AAD7WD39_9TELE|nr:hypothetical protein AAFF_G00076870 [Aldrovandia affinis]